MRTYGRSIESGRKTAHSCDHYFNNGLSQVLVPVIPFGEETERKAPLVV